MKSCGGSSVGANGGGALPTGSMDGALAETVSTLVSWAMPPAPSSMVTVMEVSPGWLPALKTSPAASAMRAASVPVEVNRPVAGS